MQAPVQAVPLQAAPVQPAPVFPNPVPPTPTQAPFQAPVFETPAPAPLAPVFETPGPAPLAPVVEYTPPLSALAPAALPPVAEPPVAEPPQSAPFSFGSAPLAPSTFGGTGSAPALVLERRPDAPRSANGPLDWIAFVLAFLAPPVGLVLGVIAVLTGPKIKGYATSVAKAAIGIGAALSVVLGVAVVVVNKIDHDQATHAAIVASSAAYCAKLTATPATLTSDTYGWPAPEDTIPESITAIKTYETYWESLAKIAPAGIEADTQKFADTAKSIAATVQSTQTLNDEGNVVQIQNLVAQSGIKSWVSNYCN
jgi:hypothetical protein